MLCAYELVLRYYTARISFSVLVALCELRRVAGRTGGDAPSEGAEAEDPNQRTRRTSRSIQSSEPMTSVATVAIDAVENPNAIAGFSAPRETGTPMGP